MAEIWQNPDTQWLPPLEYRLIGPNDKIPTPTDERGLINVQQLIQDVSDTVDPAYRWPSKLSVHHLYFPCSNYPYRTSGSLNPAQFRNLPIHKILVPRVFENWLHRITLDPTIPDRDVMEYRVEAWNVAKDLFKTARSTVTWERRAQRRKALIATDPTILKEEFNGEDIEGEEYIQTVFARNFRTLERQLMRQERIPAEFRLVSLDETPERIAARLGKLVVPHSMNYSRLAS